MSRRSAAVSLRRRVTVATVTVFAATLVALVVAIEAALGIIINRSETAVLTDHVQLARQLAAENTAPALLVDRLENRSVRVRLELADGTVLGRLPARSDTDVKVRALRLANPAGPLAGARLTLEADDRLLAGARRRLNRVLVLAAIVAITVITVGVPVAARAALAPLDTMTRLASGIARGRRGQRLGPHSDTELGRTAAAFDDMLDALEGAEQRALAAQESMRRFVADAAHELRTPLAGIAAVAEAVLAQPDHAPPQDRQQLLMMLGRETQRARRLVDDMLDLARIDSGLSLHPERTDLREIALAQVERARLLYPEQVWSVDGAAVHASVDTARVAQVLANLLNNAAAVTPRGGTVRVTVARVGDSAHVSVTDSGPGVPADDRELIFGRLVRLHTDQVPARGGAGLGLPIARGIARAHGGELTCTPTPPGTGAQFVLQLPLGS